MPGNILIQTLLKPFHRQHVIGKRHVQRTAPPPAEPLDGCVFACAVFSIGQRRLQLRQQRFAIYAEHNTVNRQKLHAGIVQADHFRQSPARRKRQPFLPGPARLLFLVNRFGRSQ